MSKAAPLFRLVGDVYHSIVDGLTIAWDMCGSCLLHITACNCREPVEPPYITKMRDNDGLVTPVARSETPNGGVRPRPSRSLSIADLVDDEVIAKVKAARG